MESRIETIIINSLITNDSYCRFVLPHLKPEYFKEPEEKEIIKLIIDFFYQYGALIPIETLRIKMNEVKGLSDEVARRANEVINNIKPEMVIQEWLVDETEKFCKNMSIWIGVVESHEIIENKPDEVDSLPLIMQNAVGVTFDRSIGHDYQADADTRFDFFNVIENRLPFPLTYFNKITKGGMTPGTLSCFFAGTGFGKSLLLCDFASHWLKMGKNVLYITLEMSEEHIASRIDANLLDVSMDDVYKVDKNVFVDRVKTLKGITNGKLFIKQLPSSGTHCGRIKSFIEELKNKKSFRPDVLVIDYIGKMKSQLHSVNVQRHEMMEYVADELRDVGSYYDIQVYTANQFNRDGQDNSDPNLQNVGDSFAQVRVYDLALALFAPQDKQHQNQMVVKQLKNRSASKIMTTYFAIGVDWDKMRLFDLEDTAQESLNALNGFGFGGAPRPQAQTQISFDRPT